MRESSSVVYTTWRVGQPGRCEPQQTFLTEQWAVGRNEIVQSNFQRPVSCGPSLRGLKAPGETSLVSPPRVLFHLVTVVSLLSVDK